VAVLLAASAPSARAENYMQKWPAADGSPPSLRSAGSSDTNIGIELLPAGTGNVGIATTSPQSLLHVYNGEVQVGSSGASCAAANNGAIRFSGSTLYYCTGTTWTSVGGGGGTPAGSNGQVQFNNSGAFGADSNLFWDNTNKRLGIGTTTPNYSLQVVAPANTNVFDVVTGTVGSAAHEEFRVEHAGAIVDTYNLGLDTSSWGQVVASGEDGTYRQAVVMAADVSGAGKTIFGVSASSNSGTTWNGRLVVQQGGNVGIGTTSPNALLDIGSAGATLGTMRLEGNTSGYVQLQSAAAAGSWTMTLPASAGSSGQQLQTDGTGITSWAAPAMVLISTQTASNSASLSWTGLGSTYNSLLLDCNGIQPVSTSNTFEAQFGEGGTPTWETATYYWSINYNHSGGNVGGDHGASVAGISLTETSKVTNMRGPCSPRAPRFASAASPLISRCGSTHSNAMSHGASSNDCCQKTFHWRC
jgi:hypothetical protein